MLQLLLQSPDFDPYSSEQKLIPPQNTEWPSNSAQMTATAAPRVAPQPTLLLPGSGEVPSKGPEPFSVLGPDRMWNTQARVCFWTDNPKSMETYKLVQQGRVKMVKRSFCITACFSHCPLSLFLISSISLEASDEILGNTNKNPLVKTLQ